jgi:adenylyl-sulfate kinase
MRAVNDMNGTSPTYLPASAGERGVTIWFTGLSGAGKSTIARCLNEALVSRGRRVEILDGDVVRTNLSKGLGFSKEDRDTNVRRIGFVCGLLSRNGVVAIAAAISPYRAVREEVRSTIDDFLEVYVECPLEELVRRDVKGLYARALRGEIASFTGVSDPYEPPVSPEVTVHTERQTVEQSTAAIIAALELRGYLPTAQTNGSGHTNGHATGYQDAMLVGGAAGGPPRR